MSDWADECRERALHDGPDPDDGDVPSRSDLAQPGVGGMPWPEDLGAAIDEAVALKRVERAPRCETCDERATMHCDRGLTHCDLAECVLACGSCRSEAIADLRDEWGQ